MSRGESEVFGSAAKLINKVSWGNTGCYGFAAIVVTGVVYSGIIEH